ncbi:hypothetical protein B0H13DRAFT_2267297 [Mycena leptocephala]|nr:hypothetical protein B0H13DRAFT_2267297 [Mycena leptocephala]
MPLNGFLKSPSFFAVGQIHLQVLSEISVHWARIDRDAPWKACLVCRLWRLAILSTPSAWSRVSVCFPVEKIKKRRKKNSKKVPWEDDSEGDSEAGDAESGDEEDADKPRPLAFWLSRARESKLFLYMKIGHPRVDFIYLAIQLLLPHFPKIKELELVVESSLLPLSQVLDMLLDPTPALEHLTLSVTQRNSFEVGIADDSTIVKGFWNFLKKSPRLRSLTLSKCLLGPMPTATGGRRSHLVLQTLTLHDTHLFTLGAVLQTIEPFLCLETLIFTSSLGCLTKMSTSRVHPIILPRLTSLTVGDDINILASLTLPKLQTLILDKELSKDGRKSLVGLLSNLFERGTNLQCLTISFAAIPNQKFSQILQHIPALVALELRHCSVEIQSLIQTTTGTSPLCPQLQTLRLCSSDLANGVALLELTVARKQSGHCRAISALGIANCKYIDDRDVEKLRKAGGPALRIDYSRYTEG